MARNEIRLMEAAIALAEELNFSRAAHRLHITQPGLTKQIAELENRLGFCLFERDHQVVTLNDAGRAFVEEARLSVLHSERATQAARAALCNAEVVIHVGRSPYTDPFLTTMLLSVHLALFPHAKVVTDSGFSCDLVRDVIAGKLDLAFAIEPPASPMLSTLKVSEAPFYIAMSEHNELASLRALNLGHLDEKSWVLFGRGVHPSLYDSVMRVAEGRKVRPRDVYHIMVPDEAFEFIVERNGVALLSKTGALRIARDGVTLRPLIEEQLTLKTYLATRGDNTSKAVSEMVRAFGRKMKLMDGDPQLRLPISA